MYLSRSSAREVDAAELAVAERAADLEVVERHVAGVVRALAVRGAHRGPRRGFRASLPPGPAPATGTRCAPEPKRLAEVMALVLPSWCGVDDERAARPCMSFWFRAASEPERPPMAVNLLSMDVIVLACAVFRGVAPLPRARAEGVCVVLLVSLPRRGGPLRTSRAGAARAALGSSRGRGAAGGCGSRAARDAEEADRADAQQRSA